MRKVLCIVLAFIICSFSIISYAEQSTDLQSEQKNLQEQINQSNENLSDVKEELSNNLQQIQEIDEKIANSESEVSEYEEKVKNLENKISQIEYELNKAEENYNKQKKVLDNRLIAMYEAGTTEYLDVLLASKNISDFLSNYYLVSEMASNDIILLEEMEDKKKDIELKKENIGKQKKELDTIKQAKMKTSTILQNTKTLRENYLSKLSATEKEIQGKIDEYTKRFAEINAQILELAKGGIATEYIGGQLAWPVPGYNKITSKYGMRTHPITGVYKLHTGVDIGAPMGADFIAANDGIVIKAEMNAAYGNMVIIDHGGGFSTLYAHGSQILVTLGQKVTRGQQVLKVGSTGYSTGAHAHFEVRKDGKTTDPLPYITNGLIPGNEEENKEGTEN